MRIKNVIFDVGGVLLDWKPLDLLTNMFDEKKAPILKANMMDTPFWAELDRGTISIDQAVEEFSINIPGLKRDIEFALKEFVNYLPEIKENVNILNKLSKKGYRLFVLSNFHLEAFYQAYNKFDFFKVFEGIIISSRVKMIKPEKQIYQYMLNQFNLVPSETVFFDDSINNIKTALEFGIIAVHTPTPQELDNFYQKKLKKEQ
ncbi:MAG: HAD family hydrolase [Bacteroidota bacterium]